MPHPSSRRCLTHENSLADNGESESPVKGPEFTTGHWTREIVSNVGWSSVTSSTLESRSIRTEAERDRNLTGLQTLHTFPSFPLTRELVLRFLPRVLRALGSQKSEGRPVITNQSTRTNKRSVYTLRTHPKARRAASSRALFRGKCQMFYRALRSSPRSSFILGKVKAGKTETQGVRTRVLGLYLIIPHEIASSANTKFVSNEGRCH